MKLKCLFKRKTLQYAILFTLPFLFIKTNLNAQNKKWIAPSDANNIKNPVPGDVQSTTQGKTLYTTYCTPCHGQKGKGDGPAAANLQVKPADHTSAAVQQQTDGAIFWELTEGHNPMPSYKTALSDQQRWALVNYIRTLTKTAKK